MVALVDWWFIKLHKRQPGERDIPVPAKARPGSESRWVCALGGRERGTLTHSERYASISNVRPSAHGAAGGACNADGAVGGAASLMIEQYQPARGRHTNRLTEGAYSLDCIRLSPGNPLVPPKRRRDPPMCYPASPLSGSGYRPCPFTSCSQPCKVELWASSQHASSKAHYHELPQTLHRGSRVCRDCA